MPYNPENTIQEALEKTEKIDFSPSTSEQTLKVLNKKVEKEKTIEELKNNPKLSQISTQAKEFLIDLLEKDEKPVNEAELKGMLFSLISNPKPSKQTEILEKHSKYLHLEKDNLVKHKTAIILSHVFENASDEEMETFKFFTNLSTRENTMNSQEVIDEYYSNLEETLHGRKIQLTLFEKLSPEERNHYEKNIQRILRVIDYPLEEKISLFRSFTPEEQIKYAEAYKHRNNLFYNPEELQENPKPEEFLNSRKYTPSNVAIFSAKLSPEEKEKYKTEIENFLLQNEDEILTYYINLPPEEVKAEQVIPVIQKMYKQLTSEIGDVTLRTKYRKLLLKHILKEDSSIIEIENIHIPKDKLAIALGISALGGDSLIAASWEFESHEKIDMLYTLSRLFERGNEDLLKDIKLPFQERGKKSLGFTKSLNQWLRYIEFLTLSAETNKQENAGLEQLQNLKKIQEKYNIKETTTNLSLKYLKEISQNINETRMAVAKNFKEYLGLEDLRDKDFEKYIKKWGNDIEGVLVMAGRLKDSYPKVQELLKKMVSAEINNEYFNLRYDLNNPLVQKQLEPLLKGKTDAQVEKILQDYHQGVCLIHKTEKKQQEVSTKEVFVPSENFKEHLKENLLLHKHFDEIFDIPELRILLKKEQDIVRNFVLSAFFEKEERILKHPKEFLEFSLEDQKMSLQEKVGIKTMQNLVSFHQFFKDLMSNQKEPRVLLNSLNKILSKLSPEARDLAFTRDDLNGFVRAQIQVQNHTRTQEVGQKTLISHLTDHPKTLLEIGKYPLNSGSCQSYDYSSSFYARSLLGYVLDSHIQAVVLRELDTNEDVTEILSIDEGRNIARVRKADQTEKDIRISKPLARSIVFLGQNANDGTSVFVPQRIYSEPNKLSITESQKMIDETLDVFVSRLNEENGLNLRKRLDSEEIEIAGSHNPEGHYNDENGGIRGQNGASYIMM